MKYGIPAFIIFFALGCVEQPKDLTKEQLEAAKPYISMTKPSITHPLEINFEDRVMLLGYDVSPEGPIKPGQIVTVTWYWYAKKKLDDGWLLFTHVEDARTAPRINADSEGVIRKNYPPGKWKVGEYIKDVQTIRIPPDWDSPTITFYIGVWFGPHRLKIKSGPSDKENRARALVLQTTVKSTEATLPKLEVSKTSSPIKIDGKLDEPAWVAAQEVKLVDPVNGAQVTPVTSMKVLWDEQNLYVAFESEDDNLMCTYTRRDDPLYDQDAVEVFLDPDGDKKNYYEFEVCPSNQVFDSFLAEYRRNKNDWTSGMKSAVVIDGTLNNSEDTDKKWTAEIAIPVKDIGVSSIKEGDKWKANFFRLDTAKAGRKSYSWSPPRNNDFHNLERFGEIIFKEKVESKPQSAGEESKTSQELKPILKKLTVPPKPISIEKAKKPVQ